MNVPTLALGERRAPFSSGNQMSRNVHLRAAPRREPLALDLPRFGEEGPADRFRTLST